MIAAIVALDKCNGIGKQGAIPWKIKKDMKHFREITEFSICIMGRLTFESMGSKPLKNRINIVISTTKSKEEIKQIEETVSGLMFATSVTEALNMAMVISTMSNFSNIFFIGGQSVYEESLKYIDRLFVTQVEGFFGCDTNFPEIPNTFIQTSLSDLYSENDIGFQFKEYQKLNTFVQNQIL